MGLHWLKIKWAARKMVGPFVVAASRVACTAIGGYQSGIYIVDIADRDEPQLVYHFPSGGTIGEVEGLADKLCKRLNFSKDEQS